MAKFKFQGGFPIMRPKHARTITLPCGKIMRFQTSMFSPLPAAWISWHEGDQLHYKVREFFSPSQIWRINR